MSHPHFTNFKIAKNKQTLEALKNENEKTLLPVVPEETSLRTIDYTWDHDESLLLKMAHQKYGEDYETIADVLGTKTKQQVRKFIKQARQNGESASNLQTNSSFVVQQSYHKSIEVTKSTKSQAARAALTCFFLPQNDSDEDIQQVKDPEMINEIIGVKTPGKTSIMTTSAGKTLKRKHEDDAVKADDDVLVIDDTVPEKKLAMETLETKSEITITPIPKKADNKDAEGAAIPVV